MVKYDRDKKSLKTTFTIYAVTDCCLKKIHGCDYNPEESSKRKISKNMACGYSVFVQTVHLIAAKANTIFTKVLTA